MRLSLILPMYKVESYIGRCLESCINQEGLEIGSDYEIISNAQEEKMSTDPFYRAWNTILSFFTRILELLSKLFG